jgi:hypothetical protein
MHRMQLQKNVHAQEKVQLRILKKLLWILIKATAAADVMKMMSISSFVPRLLASLIDAFM